METTTGQIRSNIPQRRCQYVREGCQALPSQALWYIRWLVPTPKMSSQWRTYSGPSSLNTTSILSRFLSNRTAVTIFRAGSAVNQRSAKVMPECAILPESPSDSVWVGGSWAVSLTTIPILATVTWSGDLGNAKIIADGHQLMTRWDTPGTKNLVAKCEQAQQAFAVRVRPCVILMMETSKVLPFLQESVLITAETIPRASASSTEPERT